METNTKPDNRTHVQKRKDERKEALRDYIASRNYLEAIERDLDRDIAADEVPVVKFKTETRLKLLNKILPDVAENRTEIDAGSDLLGVLVALGSGNRRLADNPPVA
jgi:hypothetical protein